MSKMKSVLFQITGFLLFMQSHVDSKTLTVDFQSGKIMGVLTIASGYSSLDTIIFGSDFKILVYNASSLTPDCNSSSESGFIVKTINGKSGMIDTSDTNWQTDTILPIAINNFGKVPSNLFFLSLDRDTTKYNGFVIAKYYQNSLYCVPSTYILQKGYNRVMYYSSPKFYAKVQINGYTDTTLGSNQLEMESRLLSLKVRYVLSDNMNDLIGNPVSTVSVGAMHKVKPNFKINIFEILGRIFKIDN